MKARFAIAAPECLANWERSAIDALLAQGCELAARAELAPRVQPACPSLFARFFPGSAKVFADAMAPVVESPGGVPMTTAALDALDGLDFILWFGGAEPPAGRTGRTRWGDWRVVWDGATTGVPGAQALAAGARTISIRTERSGATAGEVISEAIIPVRATSLQATLASLIAHASSAPLRACRAIESAGDVRILRRAAPRPSSSEPSAFLDVGLLAGRLAAARIGGFLRRATGQDEAWRIGVVPVQDARDAVALRPRESGSPLCAWRPQVRWLELPSRDCFWADPFALHVDGRTYLLCEIFPAATQRGAIAAVEVRDSRIVGAPVTVLERPYHLSYPFVVSDGDRRFCVPESYEDRRVTLYDLQDPLQWSPVATLLDNFAAVDPTIIYHEGRWWLFCTNQDEDANADLHLWHAQSLLGPWVAHAGNPVKSDVTSSRPAGTPFIRGGTLFRPAQDCSAGYGSRIVLNRVVELSPTRFVEEAYAFIEPERRGRCRFGLHTLSLDESICFVDGKERVRSLGSARRSASLYLQRARALLARRVRNEPRPPL